MQISKGKPSGSGRLARTGVELSRDARVRLAWMDFYRRCGHVAHTCRHFGISRQTFYRWQGRYDPCDLTSLEERSHRPRQCGQPTWAFSLEEKVLGLRCSFRGGAKTSWRYFCGARSWQYQRRWWAAFSVDSSSKADWWKRRAWEFRDRAAPSGLVPMPCASPGNMRLRSPVTWSKSIPWTSVPFLAWSLKVHRSRCGFPLGRAASPHSRHRSNRHPVPRHFAVPYAVFHPRRPGRWRLGVCRRVRTGLPAARPPSVRLAATFSQTQRRRRTRQSHPHRGVLPGHALLAGDEQTQPRTSPLGENLQYRSPSSSSWLLNPTPVPSAELIPTKGMKVSPIHWTSTHSCTAVLAGVFSRLDGN
jgi:hypothetical protein